MFYSVIIYVLDDLRPYNVPKYLKTLQLNCSLLYIGPLTLTIMTTHIVKYSSQLEHCFFLLYCIRVAV